MKKVVKNLFLFLIMGITLFAKTSDWPKEPVTITVPWAVGGLADQANRAIAQQGQKYLGQPIVPANRTGAGGVVALTEFLREKPNSSKFIYGGEGSFAIGPLFNKVPYKWEDFEPVVNIYKSTFILVSNPKLNISSLEELKEYGKNNKIIFAVAGLNSSEYLMLAALLTEMELDFEGVSFDGANEAMNATISGDTTIGITHASLAKEYVKADKLVPVIAFDEKPLKDEVYNLKPVTEYGYDTFFVNRCILLARKGTSKEVINKMHKTVVEIFKDPEFLKTANNLGLVLDPLGPEESKKHIDDSIEKANRFHKLLNK